MEEWKNIKGYEGLYQVSNEGRVKGLAREVEFRGGVRHQPERLLKPARNSWGYLFVCLCKNGKQKMYSVHRLVASAFIDNPDNLPQVNHKDECKTNNCVENLEYCTAEYNCNYGTHNQKASEATKGIPRPWVTEALKGVYNTKCSIPVEMLSKQGEFIRKFPSAHEAERWLRVNGFPSASVGNINSCCKGKLKSCYGFKWRYTQGN